MRENLVLDLYRNDEFSQGLALRLDEIERERRRPGSRSSTSAPSRRRRRSRRCRAATSRRSSWPASSPGPLKVLIASQPTRGVDVGSIEFIHKRIIDERDKGTAVIIVSTELDEIFALSDRIAVMYDGRIVGTVTPDIPREDIGLLMAGAHDARTRSATVAHDRRGPRHREPARCRQAARGAVATTSRRRTARPATGCRPSRSPRRPFLLGPGHRRRPDRRSATTDVLDDAARTSSRYPWDFFSVRRGRSWSSYWALLKGSVGVRHAISTTLERSAPLICAGLGVTLAFRAGLFNIGAQGQLIIGALGAGYVGFTWDLPAGHPPAGRTGRGPRSAARSGAASSASSRRAPAPTR